MKENLKKRGVLFDGNNIDLAPEGRRGSDPSGGQLRWQAAVGEDVDEAELIEEMNQINDVKYDVLNE